MKISIQKVYSKGSRKINEDALLIKDNIFAVFDGETSLVPYKNKKGETGGRIATKIAKNEFSKNTGTLEELALSVNSNIRKSMHKEKIDVKDKASVWGVKLAAVRIYNDRAEYLIIGDTVIISVFKDNSFRPLSNYFDQDEDTLMKWKKIASKDLNIYDVLKSQITNVRKKANIIYGSLNGEKECTKFFEKGVIDIKNIKSLLLVTDGFFIPKEDPKEQENWKFFVEKYRETGIKGLLKYVRSLEKNDPYCIKYPRFKQHDDATAIGIAFN